MLKKLFTIFLFHFKIRKLHQKILLCWFLVHFMLDRGCCLNVTWGKILFIYLYLFIFVRYKNLLKLIFIVDVIYYRMFILA